MMTYTQAVTSISQRCACCGEIKHRDEFYADNRRTSGLQPYCIPCHKRAMSGTKYQPKGDDLHRVWEREHRSDEGVAHLNRKAYAEREKKPCAFQGCMTLVRYRSVYKPYCDRHGTKDKREQCLEALA